MGREECEVGPLKNKEGLVFSYKNKENMGINGVGSEPSLSKIIPIRNFFIKVFFLFLSKKDSIQ